jgi:hypothetical protein
MTGSWLLAAIEAAAIRQVSKNKQRLMMDMTLDPEWRFLGLTRSQAAFAIINYLQRRIVSGGREMVEGDL